MNIALISNEAYIGYLHTFLKSLGSQKVKPYILLINSNKRSALKLRLYYPEINIYLLDSNLSEEKEISFSANIRPYFLNYLLKSGLENITYIDVDTIMYQPSLSNIDLKKSFFILRQEETEEKYKVASGYVQLSKDNLGQEIAAEWCDRMDTHIFEWFSDQVSLYQTLDSLNLYHEDFCIPKNIISWHVKHKPVFFTFKGEKKSNHEYTELTKNLSLNKKTFILKYIILSHGVTKKITLNDLEIRL